MEVVTTDQKGECRGGGTVWSVCWQAAVGREHFVHPSIIARIRWRLIDANRTGGRSLIDFVILPGEIHVLTWIPDGDSIGSVARAFGNVVSRWVREVQPVRGPLLAGPYRAQQMLSVLDWQVEARMLAWRPVFLGRCNTPSRYAHGGLRVALGLTTANGFDARPFLCAFGGSVPVARVMLRRWVAERPTAQQWRAWELSRGLTLATGSLGLSAPMARSVRGPAAALVAAGGTCEIEGGLAHLERWVVAKLAAGKQLDLHGGSSSECARGRALVAHLAVSHELCSAASVARYFGRSKSTLCEQMAACERRAEDRRILSTPLRRIIEEASDLRSGESLRH